VEGTEKMDGWGGGLGVDGGEGGEKKKGEKRPMFLISLGLTYCLSRTIICLFCVYTRLWQCTTIFF
jgi:hypothetical protein